MAKPKVAVVIIHWNKRELLAQFLPSVVASTYPNLEIVVADNASSDDSVDWLKHNYPQITILQLDKNYGYAGGYNKALQQLTADYFVLLNNDVEVPASWLEPVIAMMDANPMIGAAQPKLLQYTSKNHFEYAGAAGGFIDKLGYVACRGRLFETLEADQGQYNDSCEIFWASGACLFVKREAYYKAGGLDESFFAHMEEIDLCWRIQQVGYQNWYCATSEVYHLGGSTLQKGHPQKTYLNFRNSLVMLFKNLPASTLIWFIPYRSFLDLLSSIFFLLKGEYKNSWAIHRAHSSFFFQPKKWLSLRNNGLVKKPWSQLHGLYNGSFIWKHFAEKKQKFSEL
jgi:GT2 family glycosyltransferase